MARPNTVEGNSRVNDRAKDPSTATYKARGRAPHPPTEGEIDYC